MVFMALHPAALLYCGLTLVPSVFLCQMLIECSEPGMTNFEGLKMGLSREVARQ
jgi:hypothetical protein